MGRRPRRKLPIPQQEKGPVLHASLPPVLVRRIESVAKIFEAVRPEPLSHWLEDFQRDLHPENEIKIWENMAGVYQLFTDQRMFSLPALREIFQLLLLCSTVPRQTIEAQAPCQILTRNDLARLLDLYERVAGPCVKV